MAYALPSFNTKTQLLGLLGNPVHQSKSPLMHNVALQHQGLPFCYLAFHISKEEELPTAVEGLRALGARGWNVTVPYKEKVMPFLDVIDDEAREIGAVNTVVNDKGRLTGYNTDARGYIRSLKSETNLHFDKLKVLIIGAGGAARGIIYALSKQGVQHIIIANRTKTKSEALVNHFKHLTSMEYISFDNINELQEQSISLIINTTSVGLPPNEHEIPVSIPWINEKVMVSDLIYNPRKTRFLAESEQKGATIHNGLGMFINQGALAYELWTGQKPPIELMRKTIEE